MGLELLTGVERYKSDTVCVELDRSKNESQGGVALRENEQLRREFTGFCRQSGRYSQEQSKAGLSLG
jgi:hypothetical protein